MIPFDQQLRALIEEARKNGEPIQNIILDLECECERLFTLPEYEREELSLEDNKPPSAA